MKQIIIAILLICSQVVSAQKLEDLVFKDDLNTITRDIAKQRARLDSVVKALSGAIPKPDTTTQRPDTRLECSKIGKDPKIWALSAIKSNSLLLQFDANNVFVLQYEIVGSDGKVVFTGTKEPKSPFIDLTYDPLPNGVYTLKIRGYSCKSADDQKQFEIKADQGGGNHTTPTDPTDPTSPPPDVNVFPLTRMTEGFKEHLDLEIKNGKDDTRYVTDLGLDDKSANYIYRYMINGDLVDSDTRLKSYPIAGNNPVRVMVGKLRKDYLSQGFNKWAGRPEEINDGFHDLYAGETFSFNTSYAFQTFVAKGKQDAKGFLNHVPQNYDPSDQQVSWGDIGEELKLPAGKFWIADWKPWGVDRVFKLGVTHLKHHDLPDLDDNLERQLKATGKTFSNFQRIEHVFMRNNNGSQELWPNNTSKAYWDTPDGLPLDQAKEWAWKTDASDAIFLPEMSENVAWQPDGSPMFGAFYPELRKRYQENFGAKGIPYEIAHNYFWLGGESFSRGHSADYFKKLFRTAPADLAKSAYSPGGTLSGVTMIVEGVYLNAPDQALRTPIQLFFRLNYFKQMGYHAGVALFGQGETRPNNRYKIKFPDGDYYKEDKFPLDPNVHIAAAFFALSEGNLFVEWGGFGKTNQKLFDGREGQQLKGDWYPKGSTVPKNNEFDKLWRGSGDIYHGFTGSQDLSYFGVRLYAKTFGVTEGGTRAFLRFKIDDGDWIQVKNEKIDDVIDAYDQSRGWVLSQSKDGKIAWYYHNSFADNKWHVLTVELPNGKVVTHKVAGNGIHARVE